MRYEYCQTGDKRFIVMEKRIGSKTGFRRIAECTKEHDAKEMVDSLNERDKLRREQNLKEQGYRVVQRDQKKSA